MSAKAVSVAEMSRFNRGSTFAEWSVPSGRLHPSIDTSLPCVVLSDSLPWVTRQVPRRLLADARSRPAGARSGMITTLDVLSQAAWQMSDGRAPAESVPSDTR